MELVDFIGLGAIPIIMGLVQIVKAFTDDKRLYPVCAIIFGAAINFIVAWQMGNDLVLAVIVGVVAGLAASGLYSTGSTVRNFRSM